MLATPSVAFLTRTLPTRQGPRNHRRSQASESFPSVDPEKTLFTQHPPRLRQAVQACSHQGQHGINTRRQAAHVTVVPSTPLHATCATTHTVSKRPPFSACRTSRLDGIWTTWSPACIVCARADRHARKAQQMPRPAEIGFRSCGRYNLLCRVSET